ncbi:sigma-70 family RNA polymerase sigma factor [Fulvivirgaceae bacterium BMA10]|uniref:Sigma-70 family RNA polymerase sigma factor n=1 Tax=Splendidivirga corallicola TaxID=3051826 RepID=A0ABT8KQA0_9BACT|nr:sigma-70 family RNA polymerase sigma factor [Fulvivirgaceae bacterium BMA10]
MIKTDKLITAETNPEKFSNKLHQPENKESGNRYSDLELWQMFKKGHEGAFSIIYNNFFDIMVSYGHIFTHDRELIKDCIQDLFVDLRRSKNLSDTDSIKFYLLKGLKWKLAKYIRKSQAYVSLADKHISLLKFEVSHEFRLINHQLESDRRSKLSKIMNEIAPRQKECIYYFYYQGFSYKEIAAIMKLRSAKSARNLLYKAIKSLKRQFEG